VTIDELDLAFDEHAERGRPRHRRGSRKKADGGGGAGKSVIALVMAFLLLGGLAGGAWYGFEKVQGFFSTPDYEGAGTGEVMVQIKEQATLTDMGNALVDAGVVKSAGAFVTAAEANALSKNIQPGSYKLRKQMAAAQVLPVLLDPKNRVVNGLTIPEGRTAKDIYKILSEKTKIPVSDFEAAAKDPIALGVPDFWYNRKDGQKVTKSIEGFLFPETYEIDPKSTAKDILQQMVKQFIDVTAKIQFVDTVETERGISPYEALIVASLAQAEAGNAVDLGKVARVAYNRVYSGDFHCNCLQFDVGINYYWQLTGKPTKASKDMSEQDLNDPNNPYRTHNKPGLTPTPINNPGRAALEGAMKPPAGKWVFFVAVDKQGRSAFAETDAEHERNKATARKNGVL
jgi:UPF0755 protein